MNIAIIPARGGSKRIPGKNIRSFAGKPMIAYSIEAAILSGLFDRIIVSTDSPEIASTARKYGAEVPFLRPEKLSDDHTPTTPVLLHCLQHLEKKNTLPEYACCIYATAPLIQPCFIKKGYKTIKTRKVSSVFSVTSFTFPIFRALHITETGHLAMFWPEHELTRSNDLPEAFHDAGQFYWFDCRKFMKHPKIYTDDALPVILPRHLVQDIDTEEDWQRAEYLYKALQLEINHTPSKRQTTQ
ncbi:N-acylneuraminate cytidylyltransferase [Desulfobotulus alkaliphilus]|uniref:N-acylneuraminate cytidylyltransferase n=1 Tax=Desulfobotulus alkaliphilus TaxID=622671 RepID=A0A562RTI7_9BACT|nr:pseudaminic acid cytidylyltransferase [Desulfobotulus alkaliphilus]TWI72368.1 N-acylneuraminate cytidylyltransferase [Desulfobotulus alkaliphilus]